MTRSVTTSNPPPSILPNDALGQDTGRKRIPFTVIDQAVHVLDTPSEPWSIQLELGLRGHLDEERLAAGVRAGMQRHPMTRARQLPARSGDRNWWWEIVPEADLDPLRVLECPDDQALAFARAEL